MENIMNPDAFFIMLEIGSVWKPPDEYAPKRVETDWIMIGKLANPCIRGIKAAEKFISQTRILLLIPLIGVGDIRQRLRNQNNFPMHDRSGYVAWLLPMGCRKKDWLGSALYVREPLRLLRDGPAMSVGLPQSNPKGLQPIAGARPPAAHAILITQSCQHNNRIRSVSQGQFPHVKL
jgi:hypothetical protein